MSRHLLHIKLIAFAITLYSCAGESKNEDTSAIATESAKIDDNYTKSEFTELETPNTKLNKEQIDAFELRAIQKFEDFTDYVKIISDNDIEEELIQHSIDLMHELFINDSTNIPFEFHQRIFIKTKKIKFLVPIIIDSIGNFNGIMEASLIINGKKAIKKIDVHLVQIEKEFGESKQNITEVRLGNIY